MSSHRELWNLVRRLIRENYPILKDVRIRKSWYILGDLLAPYIGKEISRRDYEWFRIHDQGYASYRDDIWPVLEQKEGLQRPEAAPEGVVFEDGSEYTITHLEKIWDQARGFIFVEKEAEDLKPLSKYGWTIVAGRGLPTRFMRHLLKEDTRPILALHDCDQSGEGIYRALGLPTRRTQHLNIALGDRVTNLGLKWEHVKALNLPKIPEAPKYRKRGFLERAELSSLGVLTTRMKIENPILAYVVAIMNNLDLTLSPLEKEKLDMMQRHIRWSLTEGLSGIVEEAIKVITEEIKDEAKFKGTAVNGVLESEEILAPGLEEKLVQSGLTQAEKTVWEYVDDFQSRALGLTTQELIEKLRPKND